MPLLLEAKGTVVNISSVGTLVHTPWIGYYCFCKAVKPTGPSIGACIYAASKAALSLASETLRLELTPFGVHVVTVMVGSVGNTNFHANSPEYRLPPSSIYQPIERFIADTDSGKLQPPDTELDAFAADLVRDILKGRKGQVWLGNLARMTKWVSTWVPWGMFDGMVAKGRGIDVLMKTAQGGKA
ncbi:hypothetical protein MMC30_008222 [Trapelia coarctata]|nr:hypothetical protein [Trapelia coarctata]